jgi:hypothetical protein
LPVYPPYHAQERITPFCRDPEPPTLAVFAISWGPGISLFLQPSRLSIFCYISARPVCRIPSADPRSLSEMASSIAVAIFIAADFSPALPTSVQLVSSVIHSSLHIARILVPLRPGRPSTLFQHSIDISRLTQLLERFS